MLEGAPPCSTLVTVSVTRSNGFGFLIKHFSVHSQDSELMELRKTIEALQQQSAEAGLTKAALQSMQAVQRSNTIASKSLPHLDNSQNLQLQIGVEDGNSGFSKDKDALLRQDKRSVVRRHTFNTSAKENGSNGERGRVN